MCKNLIFVLLTLNFLPLDAIECNYTLIDMTMYGCEVLKDQYKELQDQVTGNHTDGKNDTDVIAIYILGQNEVEFQQVLCKVFDNLKLIHIERLEFAKREDFKFCKNAQTLKIIATELFWLPEDVFYDMGELREIKLTANKLVYLPAELLSKSYKLERFLAADNKLEIVDLQFGGSLKKIDLEVSFYKIFL